mgnify:CR=1 FL=1
MLTMISCRLYVRLFNLLDGGSAIQDILKQKTNQQTVPNVFINKIHVGGCDATLNAYETGVLAELLAGISYNYDLVVIGGGSGGLAASKVRA